MVREATMGIMGSTMARILEPSWQQPGKLFAAAGKGKHKVLSELLSTDVDVNMTNQVVAKFVGLSWCLSACDFFPNHVEQG